MSQTSRKDPSALCNRRIQEPVPVAGYGISGAAKDASDGREVNRIQVWPDEVRAYLRQQIAAAANAEERADAVRLAQRLARA